MGQDDDGDCVGHVWRFQGVVLEPGEGAMADYACELCGTVLMTAPGQPFPG